MSIVEVLMRAYKGQCGRLAMQWLSLAGLLVFPVLSSHAQSSPATQETVRPAAAGAQSHANDLKTTETVVVHGSVDDTYNPVSTAVTGFDEIPLTDTTSTVFVIPRSLLDDQQVRTATDAAKNDAAVGEDYAPVGWYPDFQIRGFPVDLASGFKINGLTIAGEQFVPIENKESVEFLKGLAGVEAGVASPGGLINYTTKRPAAVRMLNLSTDQRGTIFGHIDLGGFAGRSKQIGLRLNAGSEEIRSYVNGADGTREFGAFAADWKIDAETSLRTDAEYQHQVQHSVGGYQLLGGTELPKHVLPSTMLGEQWWAKPNTFDGVNASFKLDRSFSAQWKAYVTGGLSRSLIDDNIAYPYGSAVDPNSDDYYLCAPYWFFCADGSYGVWDYRSPGELRLNNQLLGVVLGQISTGSVKQDVVIGGNLLRRSVNLPDSVFDWVGNDNIYKPLEQFQPSTLRTGSVTARDNSHQAALILSDRIHLPGRIDLTVAGQYDTIHDKYVDTDKTQWLPQYSALYHVSDELTVYGSYSAALSLGQQAPFWVDVNPSAFLASYLTRQTEIGAKYAPRQKALFTASIYRARAPFFYNESTSAGLKFVNEGHETHRGFDLSAQGSVASWVRLTASASAIQAISDGTSTTAFNNKQVLNQPHFRSALSADIAAPWLRGVYLLPGWNYTGRKAATRDDLVSVEGYNLFNLGVRYTPNREHSRVTFRLFVDNVGNKRYWKDTGSSGGDSFLHPGAPTTVKLSTQYSF